MRLKLITGRHFTARERQVLAYGIENKLAYAKSTKIHAQHIQSLGDGLYSANVWHMESDDWGKPRKRSQGVTVQVI